MSEYTEPCCCFDSSQYTGVPDTAPTAHTLDVPSVIAEVDRLNNSGREAEAQHYLEAQRTVASEIGDWRAELTIISELLGQYRRSLEREKGIGAVNDALDLIRSHRMGTTVSGATVLINAATTMKCFGLGRESVPVFRHAAHVYREHLDPSDYRFAGLYNNMALSFADAGQPEEAERHFHLALSVLEKCPGSENELAVTWCNLAELFSNIDPEDARIDACVENAWATLNAPGRSMDGYHAFTISKCVPSFDRLGYFLYADTLRKRAEEIYAGH